MRTTAQRGYDSRHETERARWQRQIDFGIVFRCCCTRPDCTRHDGQCPTTITTGTQWDLGHTDDRTGWTGPECVPCNRSAGGRNGRAKQLAATQTIIRDW